MVSVIAWLNSLPRDPYNRVRVAMPFNLLHILFKTIAYEPEMALVSVDLHYLICSVPFLAFSGLGRSRMCYVSSYHYFVP